MGMENIEHHDGNSEVLKSPFSRIYLLPQTEQIINCAMGLKNPIDIDALKKAFSNSIMLNHPRFCSLMVQDHKGVDRWETTNVNIDDHVIIHPNQPTSTENLPEGGDEDQETDHINAYLADISVSTPLSRNKPLWEIHVLSGMKCVVLRVHHALGDGASLMSMLSACFGKKSCDDHKNNVGKDGHAIRKKRSWKEKSVWGLIKTLWYTIVFGLRLLGKVLWVKDTESVISGGNGVELWPRLLVTAKFKLDDFKFVKMAMPSATVNDVLLGLISSGLSKYMEIKSPKAMLQGLQVTGIVVVNLRKNSAFQGMTNVVGVSSSLRSSSWGNKTGLILQPVYCCNGIHPLEHVKIMKTIMDQKKQSFEAHLPYIFLKLFSYCFGPKALTMHLVSYGGNADLQVMVARDIIHDPQFLANCIQESLTEMKNCITQENKQISIC
ncbi:wax ester synthase/diacylglycerol acyltransferase 11-like isoform X2 [Silene latifolia]|uniref:wax ester synthase/diacylglycerol acyltransferase 11-like isoform X2 n=1 Tax=Silene latifolia TaxID=37657 RepID=UPI003D778323